METPEEKNEQNKPDLVRDKAFQILDGLTEKRRNNMHKEGGRKSDSEQAKPSARWQNVAKM